MKLSTYAKKLGITYQTAYDHFRSGSIRGAYQLKSGTIIVPDEALNPPDFKNPSNLPLEVYKTFVKTGTIPEAFVKEMMGITEGEVPRVAMITLIGKIV
jgi:hypothetical protein